MSFMTHAHAGRHVQCDRCDGLAARAQLVSRAARAPFAVRAAAGLVLGGGLVVTGASAAMAETNAPISGTSASASASAVVNAAHRYFGTPYRYGGTTPAGFDCSGFTGYVYKQVGKTLPRTTGGQLAATRRVSAASARPGDLVFFMSGGAAYHVAIYAGGGQIIDSPRSGKTVGQRAMWTSNVVFGRV